MRWTAIEDQLSHLIFGAALAYSLNRSLHLEIRRYPLAKPQPPLLLTLRDLAPRPTDPPTFMRLRIARELYCKSESDFRTDSPSIPILVRNFDDISALYGNHFVAGRLRDMFGLHAAFFLAHHLIDLPAAASAAKKTLGVEARSFTRSRRMAHLRDAALIIGNFTRAIQKVVNPARYRIFVVTNDTVIGMGLAKTLPNVEVLQDNMEGLATLVNAQVFIGTYRSKLSAAVNMMRGRAGWLLNTDTGDLMQMSNSQAGLLSPYIQDVEDVEFTVNERLRGCKDNIGDLREVLRNFVL
jgi:hypothetical protein